MEKAGKKGVLTRFGEKFSIWANRWVPSSLVLVLMLTILAAALALLLCRVPFFFSTAEQTSVVDAWGKGFWALLTFHADVPNHDYRRCARQHTHH